MEVLTNDWKWSNYAVWYWKRKRKGTFGKYFPARQGGETTRKTDSLSLSPMRNTSSETPRNTVLSDKMPALRFGDDAAIYRPTVTQ